MIRSRFCKKSISDNTKHCNIYCNSELTQFSRFSLLFLFEFSEISSQCSCYVITITSSMTSYVWRNITHPYETSILSRGRVWNWTRIIRYHQNMNPVNHWNKPDLKTRHFSKTLAKWKHIGTEFVCRYVRFQRTTFGIKILVKVYHQSKFCYTKRVRLKILPEEQFSLGFCLLLPRSNIESSSTADRVV